LPAAVGTGAVAVSPGAAPAREPCPSETRCTVCTPLKSTGTHVVDANVVNIDEPNVHLLLGKPTAGLDADVQSALNRTSALDHGVREVCGLTFGVGFVHVGVPERDSRRVVSPTALYRTIVHLPVVLACDKHHLLTTFVNDDSLGNDMGLLTIVRARAAPTHRRIDARAATQVRKTKLKERQIRSW